MPLRSPRGELQQASALPPDPGPTKGGPRAAQRGRQKGVGPPLSMSPSYPPPSPRLGDCLHVADQLRGHGRARVVVVRTVADRAALGVGVCPEGNVEERLDLQGRGGGRSGGGDGTKGGRSSCPPAMYRSHLGNLRRALEHCKHEFALHAASAEPARSCSHRCLRGLDQVFHLVVGVPLAETRATGMGGGCA